MSTQSTSGLSFLKVVGVSVSVAGAAAVLYGLSRPAADVGAVERIVVCVGGAVLLIHGAMLFAVSDLQSCVERIAAMLSRPADVSETDRTDITSARMPDTGTGRRPSTGR